MKNKAVAPETSHPGGRRGGNKTMADRSALEFPKERAKSIPLEDIDVSRGEFWRNDSHWPYFERLRREAPVHYCRESKYGPYWSITKYNDIVEIDTNHQVFSSDAAHGGIVILDLRPEFNFRNFIAMDPPDHDAHRKVVTPALSVANVHRLEPLIRERAGKILDELPRGETFNWVDRVSVELTTQMLATLLDFPFEQRRKLTYWSDVATSNPGVLWKTQEDKRAILAECLETFTAMWNERVNAPPTGDLISLMAHSETTRNMTPEEYLGHLLLLITAGNETTRNSISGSLYALSQHPDQYQKLRNDPTLVASMASEAIRWQSPVPHMRRTALQDFEFRGKLIKKGDKVVMWYVSGNRDDEVIDNPNAFIIDRPRPRQHLSFGYGIHRCLGNRLAELQLKTIWEEILKRFPMVEVVGDPEYLPVPYIKGYVSLPARIPA